MSLDVLNDCRVHVRLILHAVQGHLLVRVVFALELEDLRRDRLFNLLVQVQLVLNGDHFSDRKEVGAAISQVTDADVDVQGHP